MLRFALCLAALVALAPAATAAPERLSDAEHAAWTAIGRINIAGFDSGGMCTGTLIAPDLVLTAAHCLYAVRGIARARPGQVHFLAGWLKGAFAAHRTAAEIRIHPGYTHPDRLDFKALRSDLALLRLARPVHGIAPIPLANDAAESGPLNLIGYRADRANALSRQSGCRVVARQGGVIGLDCAVIAGSSGGPVLTRTPQGWRVLAVVTAGSARPGPVQTVAAPVNWTMLNAILAERLP